MAEEPAIPTPPPGPDMSTLDSNQLIAVCKRLYRECAVDLNVDAEQLTQISMGDFVRWCVEHNQPLKDEEEMVKRLGLRPDCCKVIDELFRGDPWRCASLLMPIWFIVVLQHRPPIQNAIGFVHVALTVGFRDQRVVQLAGAKEMAPGISNTDGFLISFMQSQVNTMLQQFAHIGFDEMHDKYSQTPAERPEDVIRHEIPQPPPKSIGW